MLLTLDLATRVGWTLGVPAGTGFDYGAHQLPQGTGDDVGTYANAFDGWIQGKIAGVTEVIFEAPVLPRQTQIATVRKLCGLAWHTEFVCKARGIEVREVHLQTIKKFFGGHGTATKEDMVAAAQRYGYRDVFDHNVADAIGIRLYVLSKRDAGFARAVGTDLGLLGGGQQ